MALQPEFKQALIVSQDRFVWETDLHEYHERGPRWYLFLTLAAVFFVAYAIWTTNFLFAFIVLLFAIILVLAGNESPEKILVQVGDAGIVWNGQLVLFRDIDQFAILYQPPYLKILYIDRKGWRPRLRIPLEKENPIEIRDHLRQFIKEDLDLRDEHFSDILARLLRI